MSLVFVSFLCRSGRGAATRRRLTSGFATTTTTTATRLAIRGMISKQEQPQEQRQWQSTKAATDNDNNNNNNEVLVEPPHPTDLEYQLSTPPPALNEASQQKVQTLLEQIMWLDMIEVHLLTQLVHVKMGGHWSDLQGSGSGTNIQSNNKNKAQTDDEDEDAQPKSLLQDVKLVSFDAKAKLKVIKEIRTIIPGLGLKEAKELVESAPKVISKQLSPEKAQELKTQLEAIGAHIELE